MRPICKYCKINPGAVNYRKNGKTYYRKGCESCNKHGAFAVVPRWQRAGYKLKDTCEKCGTTSAHPEIFRVFHIDRDLNNCRYSNLKTICANCAIILSKDGAKWKQGDLTADY